MDGIRLFPRKDGVFMDVKKIMGAVGALVCAINFFAAAPASAERSVEWQEKWAKKLEKVERTVVSNSPEANHLGQILVYIQKRIYNANGIELTQQKFKNDSDYKTKMHPIHMIEKNDAYSIGAGYIYIGVQHVHSCKAENFRNQYDFMVMESTISHESTHNLKGHTFYKNSKKDNELEAEQGTVNLVEKLPEGGWGVYLVGVNRDPNRPEQNRKVMDSFEKESDGKIRVSSPDYVFYKASNGKEYPIIIADINKRSDDNAYFGGQVAYCIAKGAFRPENIQIAPNNLRDIKFEGDYLLVCRSPKLPNGYRVLAGLFGDYESLSYNLNVAKGQAKNDYPLSVGFKNLNRAISTGAYAKQSVEESYWTSWMACAIAQDNANR